MQSKELQWADFKSIATTRSLSMQWYEDSNLYYITIIDGPISYSCKVDKNPSDTTDRDDFVNNFKNNGNQSFSDIDGIPFTRLKASRKGWSFWALPPEITTSTLGGSLYCKDASGTDISGISCKIYDASNTEITTAGSLDANLAACVKTVLDVELPFDIELVGGSLRIHSNPSQDVRIWIVGAPDIPANLGGSKEFASGINLKFLAPDNSFEVDGRVTKYVTYNSTTHSGKIRIIIKHPAGLTMNMQIVLHTYKL